MLLSYSHQYSPPRRNSAENDLRETNIPQVMDYLLAPVQFNRIRQVRVPSGFTGLRGKKYYKKNRHEQTNMLIDGGLFKSQNANWPNEFSDRARSVSRFHLPIQQHDLDMRSLVLSRDTTNAQILPETDHRNEIDHVSRLREKKTSSGFSGLRGKKASGGFSGLRGKKTYGGFSGLRGKKASGGFSGLRGKKLSSGFSGLRGKKSPASFSDSPRNQYDLENLILQSSEESLPNKRLLDPISIIPEPEPILYRREYIRHRKTTPSGFSGLRGKKSPVAR